MRAVGNLLVSREDAVERFPCLQVDHIEADVIAEANVADFLAAIHCVRKDASFPQHP